MTTYGWWGLIAGALCSGAALGGWLTLRLACSRHTAQLRQASDELQQRFAAKIDQLRAAQVRVQTELEQARSGFKRQLAVATEEPRAVAARAEERLRAAYDELDRLRRNGKLADTGNAELDGFALTRPMRQGM